MSLNKTYQEAADDVYADSIADLEVIADESGGTPEELGIRVAIEYLKDKRSELYG